MYNQVYVSLRSNQDELWKLFHSEVNEMIVTKSGRKMFPKLEYAIKGLNSNKLYAFMLQIEPVGDNKFRFTSGQWNESGKADNQNAPKKIWHSDGVRTGREWMSGPVSFERLKITNNPDATNACMVYLHSMHKYLPVLTIFEAPSENPFIPTSSNQLVSIVRIPHTQFIAVTAYQNQKVTDLKIQHNAFAKGFREGKQANRKRRSPSVAEYSTDESSSKSSSPQPKYSRPDSVSPPQYSFLPSTSNTLNPFLFSFPYFSQLTTDNVPPSPFLFPFGLPNFSPLLAPVPDRQESTEKKEEEKPEETEEIDVIG